MLFITQLDIGTTNQGRYMDTKSFERLNSLSEKAFHEIASKDELKEFNHLLDEWNTSVQLNLFLNSKNILGD